MTTTTLTRDTVTSDRELTVEVRAKDDAPGGRSFTGIGVPYDETIDLWGIRERFERGSVQLDPDGVPSLVLWRHDEPIGRITAGRDTDAGFEIEGQLSETERGNEVATLLRDGVITRLSIGFRPEQYRIEIDEDDTETVVHTKVRASEFSLVPFPAYSSAAVTKVRHRTPTDPSTEGDPTMSETTLTRADLDPIETSLQDLERQLATLDTSVRASGPTEPQFRSIGDYLQAVARGDEYALEFHRDTAGQTTEGSIKSETYLGEFIKWVEDRRTLINAFDTGALPSTGMSVEYAQLTENTLVAGQQDPEGSDLPGPGKVELSTVSEPIRTFGGWTELTRQVIERSTVPYLDTVMKALALEYIKVTNDDFRAKILQTWVGQTPNAIVLPESATVWDWRDAIIDAGQRYGDNGFKLEGLLVSVARFKALQRLTYNEVPALQVQAGNEFSGTLSLPEGNGNLASIDVKCIYGQDVENDMAAFYDSSALKTLKNPNAPLQLQDENIVNLTKQYSLYGYQSVIVPFPTAIVPVTPTGPTTPVED